MADGIEDVLVGLEGAVGQMLLFELATELFFGVEFGAVGWQG